MSSVVIDSVAGLPPDLDPLLEEAVAEVLRGAEMPPSFDRVREWLEEEGAEQLVEGEDPVDFMLSLDALRLSDCEMRSCEDLSDDCRVTDADRLKWARSQVKAAAGMCDGFDVPTVHTRAVSAPKGLQALLCYRIEIHGQYGPVVVVDGVFTDGEAYVKSLQRDGLWSTAALDEIPDDVLMARWEG